MNTEQNQALLALYEIESHVNPHLENINQTDPAVQYCMEQAKFHLKTAHELLEAAVLGPQTQYDDARAFYQKLAKVLPLMVLMQTYESLPPDPVSLWVKAIIQVPFLFGVHQHHTKSFVPITFG